MFSTVWRFFSLSLLFWEITGYVCTSVVILGCVGEYVAEFTDKPKTEERRRKLSRLSLIILTVGIAGELLTAIQSSRISSQVIYDLEGTVQSAKQSAQDAAGAAARAKIAADDAETKSDSAMDKSSDAQLQTGKLNTKLDSERKQLAGLDTKRVELEKSISDLTEKIKFRHVSPEQADKIKSALLTSLPGTVEIDVRPNADDGDVYCRELWDAIHSGGWTGSFGVTTLLYSGPQIHDLLLIMRDPDSPPSGAAVLLKALRSAEITVFVGRDQRLGPNNLILLVAPKPK